MCSILGDLDLEVVRKQGSIITIALKYNAFLSVYMANLAVGKMAVQSSTIAPASRATDGSTRTDFQGHSCARTRSQKNPSLQVDLAADYEIVQVVITNRGDCCG